MVSVDVLDPEHNPPGGILWPCAEAAEITFEQSRYTRGDVRGRNILFQRHRSLPLSDARFPTQDGRISLLPGSRMPEAAIEQRGALLLVASVAVDHVESYSGILTDRPGTAGAVKLFLHPRTAAEYHLGEGDRAVVENATDALHGIVCVSDLAAANTVWCVAIPGTLRKPGAKAVRSPWSLFPVPGEGTTRSSCAIVKIRPDRDPVAQESV